MFHRGRGAAPAVAAPLSRTETRKKSRGQHNALLPQHSVNPRSKLLLRIELLERPRVRDPAISERPAWGSIDLPDESTRNHQNFIRE